MLLRNYDNIMSAQGLLGSYPRNIIGSEFGPNNLTLKKTDGTVTPVFYGAPFREPATNDNNGNPGRNQFSLCCSSDNNEPNYNDYILANRCSAKYITHYYETFQENNKNIIEIDLDNGQKGWKKTYKKLYSANEDIQVGKIGVIVNLYDGNYSPYDHYILVYEEKLPEVLDIRKYTNFELSFTTIVSENPNEPITYQTEVTILDEGTDA